MKVSETYFDGEFINIVLAEGNKQLTLSYNPIKDTAGTHIITIPNTPKQEGTTTHLYGFAAEVIGDLARIIRRPIIYTFSTKNRHMKSWAQAEDKGRRVFQWDFVGETHSGLLVASKVFEPVESPATFHGRIKMN